MCVKKKLPISAYSPEELVEEKTIFVTLRDGSQYKVTEFTIADKAIYGKFALTGGSSQGKSEKIVTKIKLEKIEYVQFKSHKFIFPSEFSMRLAAMFGVLLVISFILWYSYWKDFHIS